VDLDELFLITHKKKDGAWINARACETYVCYSIYYHIIFILMLHF